MDVVLHLGMPKSGSTALQMTLADNRPLLASMGVLYPRLSATTHAHHLLMPLFATRSVWPSVQRRLGPDPLGAALAEWDSVRRQIEEQRPSTLVLSTEALFITLAPEGVERFAALLREVADRVKLVVYVREPARFYGAMLMERSKRTVKLREPRAVNYRGPIEQFQRAMGTEVLVRRFDRKELHGGDIGADFFHHVFGRELPERSARDYNVTLAPETAELFQEWMHAKSGADQWPTTKEDRQLRRALASLERQLGRPALRLRPEISDLVTYGSVDLPWLRETYEIAFDGIDYSLIGKNLPGKLPEIRRLRDAFLFDDDYARRLRDRATSRGLVDGGLSRLRG